MDLLRQAAQPDESFCDANCVWTDHHPDCALAQPERKPLTEEEMRLCFTSTNTSEPLSEGWPGLERFARAIENAHGIE